MSTDHKHYSTGIATYSKAVITPAGEVHLVPGNALNHNLFLTPDKAMKLADALVRAAGEAQRYRDELKASQRRELSPRVLAHTLDYMERKSLRRAGRGGSLSRKQYALLQDLGLLDDRSPVCLTSKAMDVLNELNGMSHLQ